VREITQRTLPAPWRKRPSATRRALPWIVGVAVLGVAGFAAWFALLSGRRLSVEASDGKEHEASVLVDGVERCRALPCTIDDIAAGARRVRVTSDGFVPTEITLTLAERERRHLAVTLKAQVRERSESK
jgi:hypothetical protein